jgi:hypothetical protein
MKATKNKKTGKLVLHLKKGALHKSLGVPQGEKIPAKKEAVKSTDSALTKKRKIFALNAAKWHH